MDGSEPEGYDGNPNYVQHSIIAGFGGTGLFRGRELDSFGLGYYYYDLTDELQIAPDEGEDGFRDEQGLEVYYSLAVTPWFFITGDLQYIDPARDSVERALILGLRANIRL